MDILGVALFIFLIIWMSGGIKLNLFKSYAIRKDGVYVLEKKDFLDSIHVIAFLPSGNLSWFVTSILERTTAGMMLTLMNIKNNLYDSKKWAARVTHEGNSTTGFFIETYGITKVQCFPKEGDMLQVEIYRTDAADNRYKETYLYKFIAF